MKSGGKMRENQADSVTKLEFAVIGDPIAHSLSPNLHQVAYEKLGFEGFNYQRIRVSAKEFEQFMSQTAPKLRGISVTMPLKELAFNYADFHDDYARLKIANTLIPVEFDSSQKAIKWAAYNTDVYGIKKSLALGVKDLKSAAVFGSGATARSLVMALLELGAKHFVLVARNEAKLKPQIDLLEKHCATFEVLEWNNPLKAFQTQIVASALAEPGARALVENLKEVSPVQLLGAEMWFDVLYHPEPTVFEELHQSLGDKSIALAPSFQNGQKMLVFQAARQLELMLDIEKAPSDYMFERVFSKA